MGGGKTGGDQVYTPQPISTTTPTGGQLETNPVTYEESEKDKTKTVDKAKMGTRGLQIPLESTSSNTTPTAASTGITI